jgi:hypothetical protein
MVRLTAVVVLAYPGVALTDAAQPGQILSRWFSERPETVLADPAFADLYISDRRQVMMQIDPKFARMNAQNQDLFLWRAETKYLPRGSAAKIVVWSPGAPGSTADSTGGAVTIRKSIESEGIVVGATLERPSFFWCHVWIANHTDKPIVIDPRTWIVNEIAPKRHTLFFEYPLRVSTTIQQSAINIPPYDITQKSVIRSGETGRELATVETPDPSAKAEWNVQRYTRVGAVIDFGRDIVKNALPRSELQPGQSIDGAVYFEMNSKSTDVILRVFLANRAYDIPFAVSKKR